MADDAEDAVIDAKFKALCTLALEVPAHVGAEHPALLPIPVYCDEIDDAITVLNEITREHRVDVARNVRRVCPTQDQRTWKKDWEERLERVKPRELYRTIAYLMYATTLLGVVEQAHADLLTKLGRCDEAAFARAKNAAEARAQEIKRDTATVLRVRNKVAAHTAFAAPVKGDDDSMRFTSLQYFVGAVYGWGPDGLVFGANHVFDGGPSPGLVPLGVTELTNVIESALRRWHLTMQETHAELDRLPDEVVMRADPRTLRVVRGQARGGG